jgi:hypothetical protein
VKSAPFPFDLTMRPIKFVMGSVNTGLSIYFAARPTGIYVDANTTVATLSVQGLPLLSPSTFEVNAAEGTHPHYDAHYGGSTSLTMPDGGSGTLTAYWQFNQAAFVGTAGGEVAYSTNTFGKPFLGVNKIQIQVIMQLLRVILPAGSYYEWEASANVNIPGLPPDGEPMLKSGGAEVGESLTFILDVTMNPPSANFTAG